MEIQWLGKKRQLWIEGDKLIRKKKTYLWIYGDKIVRKEDFHMD